jgi:hypothetical protein
MKMRTIKILTLALLSTTLFSCGGIFGGDTNGSMTCDVDGNGFEATLSVVATNDQNILTVTGSGPNADQCQVIIQDFDGVGTYTISANFDERNTGRWTESINPMTGTYTTQGGLGTGTVEITDYTADEEVSGTFSFTAKNMEGTEVSVTNGEFTASFQ